MLFTEPAGFSAAGAFSTEEDASACRPGPECAADLLEDGKSEDSRDAPGRLAALPSAAAAGFWTADIAPSSHRGGAKAARPGQSASLGAESSVIWPSEEAAVSPYDVRRYEKYRYRLAVESFSLWGRAGGTGWAAQRGARAPGIDEPT